MKGQWIFLLAMAVLLAACGSSSPPSELQDPELVALFQAINDLREKGGTCPSGKMTPVPKLKLSGPVIVAAQHHADDLNRAGVLSHETPPGSQYYPPSANPLDRIVREHCTCRRVAENIAQSPSWELTLEAWLQSPLGHCEALFDRDPKTGKRLGLTVAGLGHSGHFWVLDMVKLR